MTPGQQRARAATYRAFRRRGHPAASCLRVAYGPRSDPGTLPVAEKQALASMVDDLGSVLHECMCPGCDACVRDALWITVVDQTYGVAVGQEQLHAGTAWPHGPHNVLLVARDEPFGQLEPDQCVELVTRWLRAAGWRPDDGDERAAEICGREIDDLIAEHRATGTTFLG